MEDQSKVRLVDVQGRHEYIALSYCWGKSQRLVTTKHNLAQMRIGIKISCLAKTIQDAIVFTRKLDVRYLWVDALCIIQKGDEGADWLYESQKMAFIYAQSYVTLGAASVKDSDESFLYEPRFPFVEVPFRETAQSPSNGKLLFSVPSFDFAEDFEAGTYGSALAKRAWVKQERLFSRRTIHFTTRQIYWECKSIFWAETGEIRSPLTYDGCKRAATFSQSIWLLEKMEPDVKNAAAIDSFLRIWSELLDEYSELDLTYPTDRLPAIAGLARVASLVFPGRYLSGIWEQTLSSGLLWVPRRHPMRLVEEKCAPSWSWASTIDPIKSSGVGGTDSRITLQQVLTSSNGSEILEVLGQIHRCSVSLKPEPKPARRRRKEAPREEENVLEYKFWPIFSEDSNDPQGKANNICRFDGERGTQTEFFFLRLECSEAMAFHHCRGLLLNCEKDIASGQIPYTRVAVGWASHPVWHDAPSSVVRLM